MKIKNLIIYFIITVIIFALNYFSFGFVMNNFETATWSNDARFFLVLMSVFISSIAILFLVVYKVLDGGINEN